MAEITNGRWLGGFRHAVEQDEPTFSGEAANAFRRSLGQGVQGFGQIAEDLGWEDNFVKNYGEGVVERNPSQINSLDDIAEHPLAALGSGVGNAVGFLLPAGAIGTAGKAYGLGRGAMFGVQTANAAVPSYGGIREQQIASGNNKPVDMLVAGAGALGVGAVENVFGAQNIPLVRGMLGLGKEAERVGIRETIKGLNRTALRSGAMGVAKATAGEGFEEILQNPIEQVAAYRDPTTRAAIDETLFGGAMGALGGFGLGGIGGYQAYRQHKSIARQLEEYNGGYSENPTDLLKAFDNKEKYDVGMPFMAEAARQDAFRDDPLTGLQGSVIGEDELVSPQVMINDTIGVRDVTPKQHKKRQNEYDKMFSAPSGVFVVDPQTQQEREMTLGEWHEVRSLETPRQRVQEGLALPPLTTVGEAVALINMARNTPVIEGTPLHQRVLEARNILDALGVSYGGQDRQAPKAVKAEPKRSAPEQTPKATPPATGPKGAADITTEATVAAPSPEVSLLAKHYAKTKDAAELESIISNPDAPANNVKAAVLALKSVQESKTRTVKDLLGMLSQDERMVLTQYSYEKMTLADIAARNKESRPHSWGSSQRAQQLLDSAKAKLVEHGAKLGLDAQKIKSLFPDESVRMQGGADVQTYSSGELAQSGVAMHTPGRQGEPAVAELDGQLQFDDTQDPEGGTADEQTEEAGGTTAAAPEVEFMQTAGGKSILERVQESIHDAQPVDIEDAAAEYDARTDLEDTPFSQLPAAAQVQWVKAWIAYQENRINAQTLERIFGDIADGHRPENIVGVPAGGQTDQPGGAREEGRAVGEVQARLQTEDARPADRAAGQQPGEAQAEPQDTEVLTPQAIAAAWNEGVAGSPLPTFTGLSENHREYLLDATSEKALQKRAAEVVQALLEDRAGGTAFSEDQTPLQRDSNRWKQLVAFVLSQGMPKGTNVITMLDSTPAALQLLGIKNLPVRASTHLFDSTRNHGVARELIERVPEILANPDLVWIHTGQNGEMSFAFLTDKQNSKGERLYVALQPHQDRPGGKTNLVATINGIPTFSLMRELRNGAAVYSGNVPADARAAMVQGKENNRESSDLRERMSRKYGLPGLKRTIATKVDLVKLVEDGKAQYTEGSAAKPTTVDKIKSVIKGAFFPPARMDAVVTVLPTQAEAVKLGIPDVAQASQKGSKIRGFTHNNNKVYLVAENIPAGQEMGVFLHEVGVHLGMEKLVGAANMKWLAAKVEEWAKKDDGSVESRIAKTTVERAANSSSENKQEELIAYMVEGLVNEGVGPQAANGEVKTWFARMMSVLKGALQKLGIKAETFSGQDLVALAYGAAGLDLGGYETKSGKSLASLLKKVYVDGRRGPTEHQGVRRKRVNNTGPMSDTDKLFVLNGVATDEGLGGAFTTVDEAISALKSVGVEIETEFDDAKNKLAEPGALPNATEQEVLAYYGKTGVEDLFADASLDSESLPGFEIVEWGSESSYGPYTGLITGATVDEDGEFEFGLTTKTILAEAASVARKTGKSVTLTDCILQHVTAYERRPNIWVVGVMGPTVGTTAYAHAAKNGGVTELKSPNPTVDDPYIRLEGIPTGDVMELLAEVRRRITRANNGVIPNVIFRRDTGAKVGKHGAYPSSHMKTRFSESKVDAGGTAQTPTQSFFDTLSDLLVNAKSHLKEHGLGWLTLEQLADVVKSKTVSAYKDVMGAMQQKSKDIIYRAALIDQDWAGVPQAMKDQLSEVMRTATRMQTDPEQNEGTPELKAKYNALSPQAKDIYKRVRDYYADNFNARKAIMMDAANKSKLAGKDAAKVSALFAKMKGPYFPLMRLGRWYAVGMSDAVAELQAKQDDGTITSAEQKRLDKLRTDKKHYVSSGFRSEAEARRAAARFKADYGNSKYNVTESHIASSLRNMPDLPKVEDYLTENMPANVREHVRTMMSQMIFDMLPEHHALKRQMKREGVHGEETDMRRVFAQSALSQAHYISRLQYANRLSEAMIAVKNGVEGSDTTMRMVLNELDKRNSLAMELDNHPVIDRLLQGSYFAYLGMSPAFILTNMSQVPMITLPWLAARYGFGVSGRALSAAYGDVTKMMKSTYGKDGILAELDWKAHLNEEESALFQTLLDRNLLDITIEHDLGAVAQMQNSKLDKYIKYANSPVRITELANRAVTALAAYRLAKSKGLSAEAATEQASKAVSQTQLDYSGLNAPRHMRSVMGSKAIARVMFQFRKYQQGMVYLLAKNFYDATKALDPEERAIARRTLFGLIGTTGLMAGAVGVPFFGPLALVASMIGGAFDDDDEPFDAEAEFRNWLTDVFGADVAQVLAKGLPTLVGMDLSKRVGMGDIFDPLPFARQGKSGTEKVGNTLAAVAGAPIGMMATMYDGILEMGQGRYAKGAEKIVPLKLAQNLIRTYRYGDDGLTNKNGEIILPDEKFSSWDLAMRGAGFQPTKESEYYAANQAVMKQKEAATTTRSNLLRDYAQAKLKGEATAGIEKAIADFNTRHTEKGVRIDYSSKLKAVQARRRMAQERNDSGVRTDRTNKPYLGAGRFAAGN